VEVGCGIAAILYPVTNRCEFSETMAEFLTTREVAALLRVRERKIYDLVARDGIPFRRVTGKLLFDRSEIEVWTRSHGDGEAVASTEAPTVRPSLPAIITGGHDPLLEWTLRRSESGIAAFLDGAIDGLERARAGLCIAAGLHIPDDDDGWNVSAVAEHFAEAPWVLVEFARRRRGLLVGADVAPLPRGLKATRTLRFQGRQQKAGSQLVLERLLAHEAMRLDEIAFVATPERSETDLAEAIAGGRADVGLGIECCARRFGLRFVPLIEERFDLLVERRAWFEPPFQTFLDFCGTAAFRDRAAELGGYDVTGFGRVHFNGG
jgi:excisionase family DNA binding protein